MIGCRIHRPALTSGIARFLPCDPPQPDHLARPRQIARLRLAFAMTPAQAALVAALVYGDRGAE